MYGPLAPTLPALRVGNAFSLEPLLCSAHRSALTYQVEDTPHHGHGCFVNLIAVACSVVPETVVRHPPGYDLALSGPAQPTPARPLGYLGTLELGYLVHDAVCELTLRTAVSPIIQGPELAAMLDELSPEKVSVCRLPAEAVPILSQHYGDASSGHPVHTWPLQGGPALAGILYLLEDLVALA